MIGVAILAPFSATVLAGPITLGRAMVIAFATLLAFDLLEYRPRVFRLNVPAALLAAAYIGLALWILLSAATWGCNCNGKAGGFSEFAMIGLLAVVAMGYVPRLRGVAVAASLAGLVLAAVLALAGVGSINSGTVDLTETGGRLSGSFGNANELGFAAALGIPIALAFRPFAGRTARIVFLGTVLMLVLTILLTFSRGAIVASAIGALTVVLWESRGSWRRGAIVMAIAGACVLAAALMYAVFERERRDASFSSISPALRVLDHRDLSGWDSRTTGPIPQGSAMLLEREEGIAVRSTRAGQGASFRWGEANADDTYTLRLRARSEGAPLPFSYALGDRSRSSERVLDTVLGRRWRELSLAWRPRTRVPHATLYLWQRAGPSTFALSDITVTSSRPDDPRVLAVPVELEGSYYDRLGSRATRSERRYIRSRLDAAELALDAFVEKPLEGIGWATFPTYAATHLHYGLLAVHNQYLAIAAELGIIGVMLLALLIAAAAMGIRQAGPSRAEAAAVGVLVATAAGLVFIEALPTPQLSIPIALAAAVLCAPRRDVPPG